MNSDIHREINLLDQEIQNEEKKMKFVEEEIINITHKIKK